jgi:uncharacterized phage infection (PIP) family protein YhgE
MSLSLNDMIKKIVESEKEKNESINRLKFQLQREYDKFVASKSADREKILIEIDSECTNVIGSAKERAKSIIDSAENRKKDLSVRYDELKEKSGELADKIASLLFR